jgi:DNA repair protein RadC
MTPRDTAAYLMPKFGGRPVEQFGLVLLDTKYRVLRTTVLAIGTLNTTVVQPRDVFRELRSARQPRSSPFTIIPPAIPARAQTMWS